MQDHQYRRAVIGELAYGLQSGVLMKRIELFAALPIRSLDELALSARLREIGRMDGATEATRRVDV